MRFKVIHDLLFFLNPIAHHCDKFLTERLLAKKSMVYISIRIPSRAKKISISSF